MPGYTCVIFSVQVGTKWWHTYLFNDYFFGFVLRVMIWSWLFIHFFPRSITVMTKTPGPWTVRKHTGFIADQQIKEIWIIRMHLCKDVLTCFCLNFDSCTVGHFLKVTEAPPREVGCVRGQRSRSGTTRLGLSQLLSTWCYWWLRPKMTFLFVLDLAGKKRTMQVIEICHIVQIQRLGYEKNCRRNPMLPWEHPCKERWNEPPHDIAGP